MFVIIKSFQFFFIFTILDSLSSSFSVFPSYLQLPIASGLILSFIFFIIIISLVYVFPTIVRSKSINWIRILLGKVIQIIFSFSGDNCGNNDRNNIYN